MTLASSYVHDEPKLPTAGDWRASLVVFIVALPLSLGIAFASGASLAAGMVTAIVGGIVVGWLSGAPLAVSGPAAGLTALVFQIVQTHGLAGLAIIGFLAGIVQIIFGLLSGGNLFKYMPKTTLEGVLSAIGLIILLGQVHVLLGHDVPKGAVQAITTLPSALNGLTVAAAICGGLAIAVQLAWGSVGRLGKIVPGALPAVVLATLISLPWLMGGHADAIDRVRVEPLIGHVAGEARAFWRLDQWGMVLSYVLPALGLALVASAESLLTAKAVGLMAADQGVPTRTNLNRELIAQGAGNTISCAIGGIPLTAVMVRASANINSGARSRWSTMLHGIWIAVFVILFAGLLGTIPLAALAAILIVIGVRLINARGMIAEYKQDRLAFAHWIATTAAVLTTDLLIGLGISLALFYLPRLIARGLQRERVRRPGKVAIDG